jgi:hypothetical protein
VPAQPQKNPAEDDKGNGHVNRQHPLQGEFWNARSPISERHIEKKYKDSRDPEQFQILDPLLKRYSMAGKEQPASALCGLLRVLDCGSWETVSKSLMERAFSPFAFYISFPGALPQAGMRPRLRRSKYF